MTDCPGRPWNVALAALGSLDSPEAWWSSERGDDEDDESSEERVREEERGRAEESDHRAERGTA